MNTNIKDQTNDNTSVAVYPITVSEVKYCTQCKSELVLVDDIRYTRFGLDLCDDCLY